MPRIRSHPEADFEVRHSTIPGAGLGLFARVHVAIEETIGWYTGDIITWDELLAGRYSGSNYIMALTSRLLVVGEGPLANYTRYINHSTQPNAFLIVSTRWKKARIEAIRDIAPGDEIFFNYGEDYWTAATNPSKPRPSPLSDTF
jgi:SET domain-containing protein